MLMSAVCLGLVVDLVAGGDRSKPQVCKISNNNTLSVIVQSVFPPHIQHRTKEACGRCE